MVNLKNNQIIQISEYLDAHKDSMLKLWEEIVNMESGNMNKPGVDVVCIRLEKELKELGVKTEIHEMADKGNLLLGVLGKDTSKKPILFGGHMDTVFKDGTVANNPFRIEDGKAYGPGVLDMKAGLVIAIYAAKALKHIGYDDRQIKFIFSGDEENGHRLSNASEIILRESEGCAAAFNFETGYLNDGLVVGRKGSLRFTLEVTGVAAHSGNAPEKGRNAILEMSHKVIALQALNNYENGTTLNVGVITGGVVPNAVPDKCSVEVDIRFTKRENLDKILESINEIVNTNYIDGTSSIIKMTPVNPPLEDSESVMALFNHIKAIAEETGYGEVCTIKVGGWSDACLISSKNVPVVCGLGVKGEWNHSPKEYAIVDSLFSRTKLVAASVLTLENDLI